MNEISLREEVEALTAEQLGSEIRLLTRQARGMALGYGIQIGYRLKVAHEKVGPHGWAEWLEKETDFSRAAASRFEKLYEGYGAEQGSLLGVENNFPTLEKLSISNALSLLAVPEEEREEVAAELDAENISNRELEKKLAEREAELKEISRERDIAVQDKKVLSGEVKEMGKKLAAERERREDAEKTIAEINARPIEVAVQRDEEAIREAAENARKEAEKAAKEKLDAEKAKVKAAEEKAKSAEAKAAAADQQTRETEEALEKAKAQLAGGEDVEALKKRLEAAESGTGEAAIYCRAAQQNMAQAIEKVRAMHEAHPETAEKLAGGLRQIIEAMRQGVAAMEEKWHV